MKHEIPLIETVRLRLEPFEITKHLTARYVSWLNDPNVVRYSEQRHHLHTLDSCYAFAQGLKDSSNYFWAIVSKNPIPIHIGNLVAYMDVYNRVAELSILIGEPIGRGQGLGAEAWIAVLNYTLQVAKMRKVFAGTMSENTAMLRIFLQSGMAIECRQMRHFLFEEREVDLVIASVYASVA